MLPLSLALAPSDGARARERGAATVSYCILPPSKSG